MYFFCIVYQIVLIIDNKSASFVGSSVDEFIIKEQSIDWILPTLLLPWQERGARSRIVAKIQQFLLTVYINMA